MLNVTLDLIVKVLHTNNYNMYSTKSNRQEAMSINGSSLNIFKVGIDTANNTGSYCVPCQHLLLWLGIITLINIF
jgi:hypothetical protein